MFYPQPPRWRKRLLYLLALVGVMALSALTFIVYISLQVPEDRLNTAIPFPKLAQPVEKSEPIPDVKTSATEKPPAVGGVPSYAQFYTARPDEADPAKLKSPRPRHRAKPVKKAQPSLKAKRSS